jgi:Icc-related predicted phosphoesterase
VESGFNEAQGKDIINAIASYYKMEAEILGNYKGSIYVVPGNNDTPFIQKIINAKYPSLEQKLMRDGPFSIIGISNTNYKGEIAFQDPRLVIQNDVSNATKYSPRDGRANVISLHGPPNGYRDGNDQPEAEVITKLINEHKKAGEYLLVECGHFHKAILEDKGGVVYARSSPNVFFIHNFSDEGTYVSTTIYQRKK